MASQRRAISTSNAPKPMGTYSQGIISGNLVHLAGQLGQDPSTGKLVEGGIEAQTVQIIDNLAACLKEAGTSFDKVVARRMYFTDIHAHLPAVGAAWAKVLKEPYPASTAVQVGALALKDALLEVELVAEIP